MIRYAALIKEKLGVMWIRLCSGAAGGLGQPSACSESHPETGIDTVLDPVHFNELLEA